MSWRLVPLCVLVTLATACGAVDRIVHGSAHLRLERAGLSSRLLLDVPVEASFCAGDTTLTVVGADGSWSVAVALRTPWPAHALAFTFDSVLGGAGTAAIAIRPLRDSIGAAMTAVRGSLTLQAGAKVSAMMDFVASGARDTLHLTGSLTAPTVARGGCPAT